MGWALAVNVASNSYSYWVFVLRVNNKFELKSYATTVFCMRNPHWMFTSPSCGCAIGGRCGCRPLRRAALRRLYSTRGVPCPHTQFGLPNPQKRLGSTNAIAPLFAALARCRHRRTVLSAWVVATSCSPLDTNAQTPFMFESNCSEPARRNFESLVTSIATSRRENWRATQSRRPRDMHSPLQIELLLVESKWASCVTRHVSDWRNNSRTLCRLSASSSDRLRHHTMMSAMCAVAPGSAARRVTHSSRHCVASDTRTTTPAFHLARRTQFGSGAAHTPPICRDSCTPSVLPFNARSCGKPMRPVTLNSSGSLAMCNATQWCQYSRLFLKNYFLK